MTGAPDGSTKSGSGEAGNRTCDRWFTSIALIHYTMAVSPLLKTLTCYNYWPCTRISKGITCNIIQILIWESECISSDIRLGNLAAVQISWPRTCNCANTRSLDVEAIHSKFCRWVLNVKKSTNLSGLWRVPFIKNRKFNMIKYWVKLLKSSETFLPKCI